MRTAILAAVVLLVAPAAATARPDSHQSDLQAIRVAQVDLKAALAWETQALDAAKSRNAAKAHQLLVNARGALNDMEEAVNQLQPDSFFADLYKRYQHKSDPWSEFTNNWATLVRKDADARKEAGEKLVKTLRESNARKKEMLQFVSESIADKCTELVNLRGPLMVNGVPQGHSQLTVSLTCSDPIDSVDLALDNLTWTDVDAGKATAKLKGGFLEVDAHDKKSVSITAETTPDAASGDRLEGLIVPIHGDSAPPIDEVM